MRPVLLLAIALLLSCNGNAQWSWSHPLPQGNNILCIGMVRPGQGFAMGSGGTILITWDAGESWRLVSGIRGYSLSAFHFPTAYTGYAIGRDLRDEKNPREVVMTTTDAGEHWQTVASDDTSPMTALFFTDETTGFTVGEKGIVRKTTDGGATWHNFCLDASVDLLDIAFFDAGTGILTGEEGTLFRTTNGGTTWVRMNGLPAADPGRIRINGAASAYLEVCEPVSIGGASKKRVHQLITNDAGLTWSARPDSSGLILPYSPDFIDFPTADTGFVQINKLLIRTTDGGITWDSVDLTNYYQSIRFINGTTGFIIHPFSNPKQSEILKSRDRGASWQPVTGTVTTSRLYDIDFPTKTTGYAVGKDAVTGHGDVLKTTDGGFHWIRPMLDPFADDAFSTSFFLTEHLGYAACTNAHIYRTGNGGQTWVESSSYESWTGVSSLWFLDVKHGWYTVPGNPSVLMWTTDAGIHWNKKIMYGMVNLRAVHFISVDTGFVISTEAGGRKSVIMRTTDKGVSWSGDHSPATDDWLFRLQFFDSRRAYAVGQKTMFRTTDGGQSWTGNPISGSWSQFTDVRFMNADTGYITGNNGLILRTQNGGFTWECQESGTNLDITGIAFPSRDRVFVSGTYGTVLTGTNASITSLESLVTAHPGMNIECYPNPAGKTVSMTFTLKHPGNARIRMFDLRGALADEMSVPCLFPGDNRVTVDLSKLTTGLYAVLVSSGSESGTSRLIVSGVE